MGTWANVLISHLLLVIPMSYPCYYTNVCPHLSQKHVRTHIYTQNHGQCSILYNLQISHIIVVFDHGYIYTTSQVFGQQDFEVFLKNYLMPTKLHLFDPKYSKSSNIVKYVYYLVYIWYTNKCTSDPQLRNTQKSITLIIVSVTQNAFK